MLEAMLLVLTSWPVAVAAGDGTVYLIRGTPAEPFVMRCRAIQSRGDAGDEKPREWLLYGKSEDGSEVSYKANAMTGHVFAFRSAAYLEAARRAREQAARTLRLAELHEANAKQCKCAYCGCTSVRPSLCVCDEKRCKDAGCLCNQWKKRPPELRKD